MEFLHAENTHHINHLDCQCSHPGFFRQIKMAHVFCGCVINNYLLHKKKKSRRWNTNDQHGLADSLHGGWKVTSHQRLIVAFTCTCWITSEPVQGQVSALPWKPTPYHTTSAPAHTHTHWGSNYCSIQHCGDCEPPVLRPVEPTAKWTNCKSILSIILSSIASSLLI